MISSQKWHLITHKQPLKIGDMVLQNLAKYKIYINMFHLYQLFIHFPQILSNFCFSQISAFAFLSISVYCLLIAGHYCVELLLLICSGATTVRRDDVDDSVAPDDSRKSVSTETFMVAFGNTKKLVSVALIEGTVSLSNQEDKFPVWLFDISSMWKLKLLASVCVLGELVVENSALISLNGAAAFSFPAGTTERSNDVCSEVRFITLKLSVDRAVEVWFHIFSEGKIKGKNMKRLYLWSLLFF